MLDNLSTAQKVLLVAGVGVAGYVIYTLVSGDDKKPSPPVFASSKDTSGGSLAAATKDLPPIVYGKGGHYYDVVASLATIYELPSDKSNVVGKFQKGAVVDASGNLAGGFIEVMTPSGSGWVKAGELKSRAADLTAAQKASAGLSGLFGGLFS